MPRKPTGNKPGRPRKTKLNERQLRAVEIDFEHRRWGNRPDRPAAESSMPTSQLAKRMNVGKRAVEKWRKDPLWHAAMARKLVSLVDCFEEFAEDRKQAARIRKEYLDRVRRTAALTAYVEKHWTGPTPSPIDGRVLSTPSALVKDLDDNGCLPLELARGQLKAAEDHLVEMRNKVAKRAK